MDRTFARHLLLGAAVLGQAIGFAVVVGVIAAAAVADPGYVAGGLVIGLGWLLAIGGGATVLCTAALPALVRHAQESHALDEQERRRWLIRLALWGPVTMPVYWRRYVLGGRTPA
jgi:hypothetical protein